MLNVNLKYQILSDFRGVVEMTNWNEDSLQSNQIKRVKGKRQVSRNGTTVLRSTRNESVKSKII